jgi:hypothetical protein
MPDPLPEDKKPSFHLFGGWGKGESERAFSKEVLEEETEDPGEDLFSAVQPSQKSDEDKGVWSSWAGAVQSLLSSSNDDSKALETLVEKARMFQTNAAANDDPEEGKHNELKKIQNEFKTVFQQMEASFGRDLDLKLMNPLSFNYYLEVDESVKTPSWKRRRHRFCNDFEFSKVFALHDALYLAEASYLDSVDDITEALENYKGASYLLVFCQTEAEPREPAHFIAIKKGKPKQTGPFPWQKDNVLEVLMVVRGTKEISDMFSDCLLESREFRGGYAHDGVCQSGLYLVEKQTDFLQHLLTESGRESIRLSLIGHSLGAGAAAIACIEFNDVPGIEATCVGFGCPALLTKEISEEFQSRITTVVCDADCVPRMSKISVSNLMLDVMSNDWTDMALEDVKQLVHVLQENIPFELPQDKVEETIGWVSNYLSECVRPDIAKVAKERSDVQLSPPGKCIHMYRDGQGVSIQYVSCDFFNEFDVCYTMVDDHLIPSGYNRLLHDIARQENNDSTFFFRNDVNALRFEKHLRPKKKESVGPTNQEE